MTAPVVSIGSAALQKGMPANIEAEQFVLGSILLDEEGVLFPQVAGALTAADGEKNGAHAFRPTTCRAVGA